MKILLALFLLLCVGICVFLFVPSTQGQKERDEPTVVHKGEVTEMGKGYSKEFQKRYANRKGRKLGDLAAAGKESRNGKEIGVAIDVPTYPALPNQMTETSQTFLSDLACNADAVVLGSITAKSSQLTEDETFIYTDYQFTVDEVIKDNVLSPISLNAVLEVARPRGLISLDGQV
ncbi:MAG: hypothetical protein ACRD43_06480, partial [Pyrinomonadaceae bacterium]